MVISLLDVIKFQMKWMLFNFLVDEQIGTLTFSAPVFPSIAVPFNIVWIKFSHPFVIELNPSRISLFNIAEIVPKLSTTIV